MLTLRVAILLTGPVLVLGAGGCGGGSDQALPVGSESVTLDPSDFTSDVDNHFWPMEPGTTWIYRGQDAEGDERRVVVSVPGETKTVLGIQTRVVHQVVTEGGEEVEDTYDWYAQDAEGNVWHLGTDTKDLQEGKVVSTDGSWEAGIDGAQPGIAVPAEPKVGLTYRREYAAREAEDAATVLSLDERVETPIGWFAKVLMTKDVTPVHPEARKYTFYARGFGPVLVLGVSGASGRTELVKLSYRRR